jgi:signal transduction histidine kinase
MSHELRTPLNVVAGYTSLIMDGMLGTVNEKQKEALGKILSRANDELSVVNNILYATVLETGDLKVDRQVVTLGEFLGQIQLSYDLPLQREVALDWQCVDPLSVIYTDGGKLKHILQNLIDNALKFTTQCSVMVPASCSEDHAQFKVSDTGMGIPEDLLSAVFEKFKQVDSSETCLYGGVGIGLYIVRRFADLIGGKVEVQSQVGKGSTFTVTIPCKGQPS